MFEIVYYDEDENCVAVLSIHHTGVVPFEIVEYLEVTENDNIVRRAYI